MLTNPHFGYWKTEYGYNPDIWFENTYPSQTHYNSDSLIAVLLSTVPKYYSQFLKYYGALGPQNGRTYFENLEDCEAFLEILELLYNEVHENGVSFLSAIYKILNNTISSDSSITSSAEERTDYYLSNAKTYWNQQQYQGTPWDINISKRDVKDINMGHIMEDPFKPGRSKKPTHYTMLHQ